MKTDEALLLLAIALRSSSEDVRSIIDRLGVNHKRACYLLGKWAAKGWYNYGVTVDLGWLTEEGLAQARTVSPQR